LVTNFRRNLIVGAGLVLDHGLLPPGLRESLREGTAEHVGHPAGRGGHDQRDRPRRVLDRLRSHGIEPADGEDERNPDPHSANSCRLLAFCRTIADFGACAYRRL
jgi:hypothetical protein